MTPTIVILGIAALVMILLAFAFRSKKEETAPTSEDISTPVSPSWTTSSSYFVGTVEKVEEPEQAPAPAAEAPVSEPEVKEAKASKAPKATKEAKEAKPSKAPKTPKAPKKEGAKKGRKPGKKDDLLLS